MAKTARLVILFMTEFLRPQPESFNQPQNLGEETEKIDAFENEVSFCPFCDGLENDSRFYQQYPELNGFPQVLFETESVMVLPDLAPVKSGHILIVPKKHVTSYAFLDDSCRREFAHVYDRVKQILNKPDTLEFEHGSGFLNNEKTTCGNSVFHAHWHVIPISESIEGIKILDKMLDEIPADMDFKSIGLRGSLSTESFLTELSENSGGYPYLVFSNSDWAVVLREEDNIEVPSQILRRISALVLHGEKGRWNWKNATDNDRQIWLDNLRQTYHLFGYQI